MPSTNVVGNYCIVGRSLLVLYKKKNQWFDNEKLKRFTVFLQQPFIFRFRTLEQRDSLLERVPSRTILGHLEPTTIQGTD